MPHCPNMGGGVTEEVHHLFRGSLMPGSWWQTYSMAVKDPKFPGKLSMRPVPATWRWQLAFTAVQLQSKLLLDRLQLLGDGASETERRRGGAVEVERRATRKSRGVIRDIIHFFLQ